MKFSDFKTEMEVQCKLKFSGFPSLHRRSTTGGAPAPRKNRSARFSTSVPMVGPEVARCLFLAANQRIRLMASGWKARTFKTNRPMAILENKKRRKARRKNER